MTLSVAFLLLCVLCCVTFSFAFVFEDCGSELAKLNEVSISSCDISDEKCSVARGKDTYVSAKFTPNTDISDIKAQAFGVLMDVPIPFSLEKPNVCEDPDSGIKCPLKKDQEAEYKVMFNLDKKAPTLSIDAMWEFRNENDEKILCIKFPVKVV